MSNWEQGQGADHIININYFNPHKRSCNKRKMKEAKLCLPVITKRCNSPAVFNRSEGREKRVILKIHLQGGEGTGNLLIIRMI